jgi:hypothetical protein
MGYRGSRLLSSLPYYSIGKFRCVTLVPSHQIIIINIIMDFGMILRGHPLRAKTFTAMDTKSLYINKRPVGEDSVNEGVVGEVHLLYSADEERRVIRKIDRRYVCRLEWHFRS